MFCGFVMLILLGSGSVLVDSAFWVIWFGVLISSVSVPIFPRRIFLVATWLVVMVVPIHRRRDVRREVRRGIGRNSVWRKKFLLLS